MQHDPDNFYNLKFDRNESVMKNERNCERRPDGSSEELDFFALLVWARADAAEIFLFTPVAMVRDERPTNGTPGKISTWMIKEQCRDLIWPTSEEG